MASDNPYIKNPGKRPYLRCNAYEGMHPSECVATFITTVAESRENPLLVVDKGRMCLDPRAFENMVTVDVGQVSVEGSRGLLEIFDIFCDDGTKSLIKIPDKGNGGDLRRYVPNAEIVWI